MTDVHHWPLYQLDIKNAFLYGDLEDEVYVEQPPGFVAQGEKDRIRNEVIRDKVGVTSVEDKLWESRLRWFGHVKRRDIDASVRSCERLSMAGLRKGIGRPKKYWGEVIRQDMLLLQLTEDMTHDRKVWRLRIRVVG
uniref:Reverse transcriptase Ty1/copia-type domain-containing protein n=1 Tax=Nicotiana tabacum TaxID=4097 RepID=A0A1S4AEF7_TOBAC|nr:PREDICTED: uncharacterized protein LOC107796733 [Nicotiana tabacum]